MTDLETFRALLAERPPELRTPEIDGVMRAGARIRRRHRLFTTTAIAAGVAAVLTVTAAGGTLFWDRNRASGLPAVAAAAGSSQRPAPSQPAPGGAPRTGLPATSIGLVPTGIREAGGELILYIVYVDALPDVHFGVAAGLQDPTGLLNTVIVSNEVNTSDRAPGFHAVQAPAIIRGNAIPEFGYYAGPAQRIAGQTGGRTVTAHQVPVVPVGVTGTGTKVVDTSAKIVIFWFDPGQLVSGLTAYDSKGHRLPTGDATIHRG